MTTVRVQRTAVFSAPGLRPAQEDHAFLLDEKKIFVVADGFGGPQPGADASKTACEAVRDFLNRGVGDQDATLPFVLRSYFSLAGNVLFNALIFANRKVKRLNRDKSVHARGGASVVAGYMDGDLLALASVGGCEAWLIRKGQARSLVTPRTYAKLQNPFDSEDATDAIRMPLTALGMSEDLEPEIYECKVEPGDWILLHTDGITSAARTEIIRLQGEDGSPATLRKATDFLSKYGEEQGYKDNATAALVCF